MSQNRVGLDVVSNVNYTPTQQEKKLKEFLEVSTAQEIEKYLEHGAPSVTPLMPKNMSFIRKSDGSTFNRVELPTSLVLDNAKQFFISESKYIPTEITDGSEMFCFVLFEYLSGKKNSQYFVFPYVYVPQKKNKDLLRHWELVNNQLMSVKLDIDRLK